MKSIKVLSLMLMAGLYLTVTNLKANAADPVQKQLSLTVVNNTGTSAGYAKLHSADMTYALDKGGLIGHTSYKQVFDVKGQLPTAYEAQFYYAFPHELINCSHKFSTPPTRVTATADSKSPGTCTIVGN